MHLVKFRKKCNTDVYFIFSKYDSNKKNWSYVVSIGLVELLDLGDINDLEREYVDVILVSGEKIEVKFLKFLTEKRAKITDHMLRTVNNSKKGIDAMIFSTLTAKYTNQKQEFIFPFTLCLNGLYISTNEIQGSDSMAKVASEIVNEFKQRYDEDEKEIDPDIARLGIFMQHISENTDKKFIQTRDEMKKDVADVKEDVADVKEDVADVKEDVADVKEDVAGLKDEMTKKIDALESKIENEINALESKIENEMKDLREFLKQLMK